MKRAFLREDRRKSGTDDMFIESEYHTTTQQSRRDDIISISKQCIPFIDFQSGTDDMFIASEYHIAPTKSHRDDMPITHINATLTKSINNQT
jgi:hypothetical protein